MKILTIAATPFFSDRGCHIRIYNEAKYLGKMGAKVRLCTYHLGENVAELDIKRIRKAGWYKKLSPGFHWGKIWLDFKLLFLVRREIRNFQPDAIHAHLYEGLAIGHLAKKLAFRGNIPIVFDLQGNLDEEFISYNKKNKLARKLFSWLAKKIIRRADEVAVSSENVKIQNAKIVKDGVDFDLFQNLSESSLSDRKKIRKIKEWQSNKKLLVYIGGLSDNKGVGNLLKSFGKLQNNDWKLLFGGFGSDEEKYKNYIKDNKLEDFVYFTGKVDYFSLPHYLALADVAIDPKRDSTESSGKLVNYMAAGLPIICFENEFNQARLEEKGFYLKSFDGLQKTLTKIENAEKVNYGLESLSEEKEVRKLHEIFHSLAKDSSR